MPVTLHHAQVFSRAKAVRDAHARFCDACLPGLCDLTATPPTLTKGHHPDKVVDLACASKGLPEDANQVALLIGLYQKLTISAFARGKSALSH
jgi:hypothetical protein